MADISKIVLPNGSLYNIKDTNAVTLNTVQTIIKPKAIVGLDSDDGTSQPALLKLINTNNATSTSGWQGRIMAGSKNLTFLMGTYRDIAGIGAHSWTDASAGSGASWADFYLNPDGNKSVYIGGKSWTAGTGYLEVRNSDGDTYVKNGLHINNNAKIAWNSTTQSLDITF